VADAMIKARFHMSLIFITHNLGVVAHTCDTIGVRYASHLVEVEPQPSCLPRGGSHDQAPGGNARARGARAWDWSHRAGCIVSVWPWGL